MNTLNEAFRKIKREDFVPAHLRADAGEDQPLPIGFGQTISQPYTVCFMLEQLEPREGERVLDVGAGSGWTTALLAQLVGDTGEVVGVERLPELVEFGRANLAKYPNFAKPACRQGRASRGKPRARIELVGTQLGWPVGAPFDRILVSAAAQGLPSELLNQLAPGGIMVIPIKNSIVKITKNKSGETTSETHEGFAFVPLIQP